MKTFELKGTARTIAERSSEQKKVLKAMRRNNQVPCILYGVAKNAEGTPTAAAFTVTTDSLRKLVYTPDIFLINLSIDGTEVQAILKDIQFHPVKDTILHVDFLQVEADKPIVIEVPVALQGLAEGVKAGGKMSLQNRKLRVKALYKNVPEKLDVDVTNLGLGKTIQVGQLSYEGLELLNAKDAVVCAVKLTRAARGLAAANKG